MGVNIDRGNMLALVAEAEPGFGGSGALLGDALVTEREVDLS